MSEGLVVERPVAAGASVRVRSWPLPASAQLLRRVVADVLGAAGADSLPLVLVSPVDGLRSLPSLRRVGNERLELPLSDLVVGVPDGVDGDEPGHLLARVRSGAAVADRLERLRRSWGAAGPDGAWMCLTAVPVASAAARCGALGPRLAGTRFAGGRLVFGGLDIDSGASS
jgi:hypothetical protein